MGKFKVIEVELQKIINESSFDTFWIYWETDIVYDVTGNSSQVMVRTHDKVLTDSEAYLITGSTSVPIPIGTYSIGTYSNPYPVSGFDDYTLVVATVGYINDVLNGITSVGSYNQTLIPNVSETYFEWEASTNILRPIYDPSIDDYTIGASYSALTLRII